MTAAPCTATVTVVGIGTFTCELLPVNHDEVHSATLPWANLPGEKWVNVSWTGDTATIAPPGSRRGRS